MSRHWKQTANISFPREASGDANGSIAGQHLTLAIVQELPALRLLQLARDALRGDGQQLLPVQRKDAHRAIRARSNQATVVGSKVQS